MIEIYQSDSQQYGISTFNDTINEIFNNEGLASIINTTKESIDDEGVYIYSSKDQYVSSESEGKHIFVVHGLHNDNFLPPLGQAFHQIWCFSDRSQKYLVKNGYKNVVQVPQVINDHFWKLDTRPQGHVLIIDPRNGGFYVNHVHKAVMHHPNLGVRWIGGMLSPEDLRDEIANASVVIAKGRSAMESILCQRPTIIHGHESSDGLVTTENIEDLMTTNMSGWSKKEPIVLWEEIEQAMSTKWSDLKIMRNKMKYIVGSSLISSKTYLQ